MESSIKDTYDEGGDDANPQEVAVVTENTAGAPVTATEPTERSIWSQDDDEEHADREDQDVGVLQVDVRQGCHARRKGGVERPEQGGDNGDERNEDAALTQVSASAVILLTPLRVQWS